MRTTLHCPPSNVHGEADVKLRYPTGLDFSDAFFHWKAGDKGNAPYTDTWS